MRHKQALRTLEFKGEMIFSELRACIYNKTITFWSFQYYPVETAEYRSLVPDRTGLYRRLVCRAVFPFQFFFLGRDVIIVLQA